jgi:heme exporter protein D
MSDFFAMGGYAAFVWPAYGVSALGLGSATALVWLAYRRAAKRVVALERGP